MASLAGVKERILAGRVVGLQGDIKSLLLASSSAWDGKHIIRSCSRFVYENQDLDVQSFSAVVEIVALCCQLHHDHLVGDPTFHVRSLFYVASVARPRKELHHHFISLSASIEPYLELCDTSKEEAHTTVKRMYVLVWNASLTIAVPLVALTLQRVAFQCLLATGGPMAQVCDQAIRVHTVYETAEKNTENSIQYFQAIFKYLTQALSKQSTCGEDSVLALVGVVMEYAKVALLAGRCSDFGRNSKQVVKLLEAYCDSQMMTGLKAGLKLPEMAIGLRLGRCGEELLMKLLGSCGVVAALPGPNTVLILGLLTTLTLLQQPCSNLTLSSYIVELVMKRCRIPVSDEVVTKISCVLHDQLAGFFEAMNGGAEPEPETFFGHMLAWANATKPFVMAHLSGNPIKMRALYSFGVHFCNFGSMAYRKNKYDTAGKLLEVSVDLFEQYRQLSSQEQKLGVLENLTKKLQLWSDVLRYGGQHWEAGVAAARGFLMGCLTSDDLVSMWVKCKRDAKKEGSEALKHLTVCDAVREARRRYREAKGEGVLFDQDATLVKEILCYKQQKYNTSEEQLFCGRVVARSKHGVESRVRGLLAVVEALWTYPGMEAQEQEASSTVQQAKAMLQEAQTGDTNKPILLELEALVHFWQYLCYIQVMYAKADAKMKEVKKINVFSAQVTEPGEEEQVHDRCEGRPMALLSLHTQHTSLAPLQAALHTWDKIITQNLPLENASVTCASVTSVGYIFHLSGLDACTIQAWGLLIALARRHSLQHYLIKGIVELILTAPELVDPGLLGELEQAVTFSVPASPQDTSHACLLLSASAATAFLYYKTGQYEAGMKLIQTALQSEVLGRRTIKSTEAQTLVHLVASLYAWLPPWLLPCTPLPAPCFSLAFLACREALALVMMAVTDSNTDIICWRHRVASLLLTTSAWLGHLSITTAQPRVARAYIEKSLEFAQQLILPLRIAEFLELSARVDVLCDQLEDCRVKIDSLETLLRTHPSPQEEVLQDLVPEFTKLSITKPSKIRTKKEKGLEIFCDGDGERMRTDSGVQELRLQRLLPIKAQDPIDAASLSPIIGHLGSNDIVRFSPCPVSGVQCVLCATPIIHHLRVSTAVLLALLHAHSRRSMAAQKCLDQAQSMYVDAAGRAEEVSGYMASLVKRDGEERPAAPSMFVKSRLSLVHLQIFHARAECLALEGKWQRALAANLESLQVLASQDTQLLIQNMHYAAVLSLQGQALEQVISRCAEAPEDIVQPAITGQKDDDIVTVTVITTPEMRGKSSSKTTRNLLNAPKQVKRRNLRYNIPSDDEENSAAAKPASDPTPQKQITQTPYKFFKSKMKPSSSVRKKENVENKKIVDTLAADWCDTLPSVVLNVPSDLPVPRSPLNSMSQYSSLSDGERLGPATAPRSTSKTRNTVGQRAGTAASKSATTRGRRAGIASQSPDDVKPQGETATSRGRGRGRPTKATSKAKVAAEPKPSSRTRASRSLRLI